MFREEIEEISKSAYKKVALLNKNFIGYFVAAILAGAYVALGVAFAFTVGGMVHTVPGYKLIIGICFTVALSFVAFGGSELFTGNVFVMSIGVNKKTIKFKDLLKLWVVCYLGNLIGSLIIAYLIYFGGFLKPGAISQYFVEASNAKISLTSVEIFIRSILCNILVCLATWCGYRCKTESGKLIMIFWCIIAFVTTGFEHSIANMSLFTMGMLAPDSNITINGILHNIPIATIGNIIGGVVGLAIPYLIISKKEI